MTVNAALSRVSQMAHDANGEVWVIAELNREALLTVLHSHEELLASVKALRRMVDGGCICHDCQAVSDRADTLIARAETV